jgi:glycosyltransferase involved in cell wall biosynthesis
VDTTPFDTSDAARDLLRPATRAMLGIADDRLVLLVSGNLSDRHGIDQAIAAGRALPDDLRCRAVLVFVGQGGRREALVATACLPPAVDVRFAGFQDQSALSRFYHAADLLVIASRPDDTWDLAVNEALHHGLPCVVSPEVGCGPDLVQAGRTGERASAASPVALAGAIAGGTALIGRPEVRDACRERAALYSLEPAAAGIARAYHDVAAAGAGAPSYALR